MHCLVLQLTKVHLWENSDTVHCWEAEKQEAKDLDNQEQKQSKAQIGSGGIHSSSQRLRSKGSAEAPWRLRGGARQDGVPRGCPLTWTPRDRHQRTNGQPDLRHHNRGQPAHVA